MSLIEIIILIAIVIAFAVFMAVKSKNKNEALSEESNKSSIKEATITAPQAQKSPAIQAGIEEETVAAIMAAISCLTDPDSGARYAVKSINRAKSERPVWCFAGMQQNTRPF